MQIPLLLLAPVLMLTSSSSASFANFELRSLKPMAARRRATATPGTKMIFVIKACRVRKPFR